MITTPVTSPERPAKRPLLGLRERPGRLALTFMHLPLRAHDHGQGRLLGHTFLQFTHVGRKSGKEYHAVAMVLRFDHDTGEAVICAAWDSDWCHNLQARPATNVKIDRLSFTPVQRRLTDQEAFEVVREFLAVHPHRGRVVSRVLGWSDLRDDAKAREFSRTHPFFAFRPE